ncbi:MAG: polyprenyl synthetase family protein [Candidatus Woesearchaeota archaeon]
MIDFKKQLEKERKIINKELIKYFNKKEKYFLNEPKIAQIIFSKLKEFTLRDGKRLRAILVLYGYKAFYKNNNLTYDKEILNVAIAVELMQSFLLIHDDIIDNDNLRRNKPTMHKVLENEFGYLTTKNKEELGKNLAIIAGDIISVLGSEIIENTKFDENIKLKAIKIFNETIIKTCIGQTMDILSIYDKKITEKEIKKIQQYKTSIYSLYSPLKLGSVFANSNNDELKLLKKFAMPLGEAFQIQDDILGLIGDKKKIGKNIGSDIKEGKKTLLVIKAIKNSNEKQKQKIKKYLGKKDISINEINEFIKIITETKSLDYSINKARRLIKKSKLELKKINMNDNVKIFLESIADFMLMREY